MKTRYSVLFAAILFAAAIISFSGCYTQMATIEEEERPAYRNYDDSTSSTEYDGEYRDYQRSYVGFYYYYPAWRSWYVDPWYCSVVVWDPWWSPWWWTPAVIYPSPYWWHHGYYGFHHYAYYDYGYYGWTYNYSYGASTRWYNTRNSGVRRTGGREDRSYGINRASGGGAGYAPSTSGRTASSSGSAYGTPSQSRSAGTSMRGGRARTQRVENMPSGVSTNRSTERQFRPDVQQPRHRDAGTFLEQIISGTARRSGIQHRTESSDNSQESSRSGNQTAPSYRSAPSAAPSAPAPSAPAPSRSTQSGGGRSEGSSRRR